MKLKFLCTSLLLVTLISPMEARSGSSWLFSQEDNNVLLVAPRILAQANGKTITVVDLMRKMDMAFYEKYPEYADSLAARYQFYQVSWRNVLQDLIDQELMLADAEEMKIELSRGEVRKEMEKLFGPNVVANLQKAGLQYDEAVALVRADMLIQRLLYFKVHTPSLRFATPKEVQIAYEDYKKTNQLPAELTYRVISIRSKDLEKAQEAAKSIHERLTAGQAIDDVISSLQVEEGIQVSCTQAETRAEADLSENYREVLTGLEPNAYSQPLVQKNQRLGENLLRIFHLAHLRPAGAPPLAEVEDKLKEELLGAASQRLTLAYLKELRARYRVEEIQDYKKIPEEFQPFQMIQ